MGEFSITRFTLMTVISLWKSKHTVLHSSGDIWFLYCVLKSAVEILFIFNLNHSFTIVTVSASLVAQRLKRLPAMRETRARSLSLEDPLEKEMATHSSTLAWKIPWTEEPGRLQSVGSQRVGHDWGTSLTYWHTKGGKVHSNHSLQVSQPMKSF